MYRAIVGALGSAALLSISLASVSCTSHTTSEQNAGDIAKTTQGEDSQSALSAALRSGIRTGDWRKFELLAADGKGINLRPNRGLTVAEEAVALGYPDKAIYLLDHGYSKDLEKLLVMNQIRQLPENSSEIAFKKALSDRLKSMGLGQKSN